MENDLMDSLTDLCLEGSLEADELEIIKVLEEGAKSYRFTKLVAVIAQQIKTLCNLEETVHKMVDNNEYTSFLLELSSFLKELGCPYQRLVTGHLSSRLQSKEDRMLLLDYLISELMAARMVHAEGFKDKDKQSMEIVVQESTTAKDLKDILIALKFNKPPPNITPEMLFSKLEAKLKDTIGKEGEQLVGKPLYNKAVTEKEWAQLEAIFLEMYEDYQLRKETLITRLECTIQSFEWSDRNKNKESIQAAYRTRRDTLKTKPDVKLSDFLAARTSLLQVEKTSSARVRKEGSKSEVYKVIMGGVPDRGGRPHEQQPPPPEMPSWQQRSQGGGGRGGGGGGFNRGGGGGGFNRGGHDSNRGNHDGGRGGFNSGGFNSGSNDIRSGYQDGGRGGFNSGGGNHDGGRGGYDRGRGGRGGRVQGSYTQGSGDRDRPQTTAGNFAGNFNQKRNYQTYEVPSGGYGQPYSNPQSRVDDYQHNSGYSGQGYNSARGYERTGSHDSQWSQGSYGNSHGNQGYQSRGGYQNEHDDRDRRGRGGGVGGYRGGRR